MVSNLKIKCLEFINNMNHNEGFVNSHKSIYHFCWGLALAWRTMGEIEEKDYHEFQKWLDDVCLIKLKKNKVRWRTE